METANIPILIRPRRGHIINHAIVNLQSPISNYPLFSALSAMNFPTLRRLSQVHAHRVLPIPVRDAIPGPHPVEKLLAPKALVTFLGQRRELDRLPILKDKRTNHPVGLQ